MTAFTLFDCISTKPLIEILNRCTKVWMAPFPSWHCLHNWMWILASFESHANNWCISRTFWIQTSSRRQLSKGSHWWWARRHFATYLRPAGNNLFVNHYRNLTMNEYFLIWKGAVETSAYVGCKSWLILVPEQVGEIDSSEVKDIKGHHWKFGEL